MKKQLTLCVNVNAIIFILLSAYVLLIPAGMVIYDLQDPGLYTDSTPLCAFRWHKHKAAFSVPAPAVQVSLW